MHFREEKPFDKDISQKSKFPGGGGGLCVDDNLLLLYAYEFFMLKFIFFGKEVRDYA